MTLKPEYPVASSDSVRGGRKGVGGRKRTKRGKFYPPHSIAIISYCTHSERSYSKDESPSALTDGRFGETRAIRYDFYTHIIIIVQVFGNYFELKL
jgi:hypothetical protein